MSDEKKIRRDYAFGSIKSLFKSSAFIRNHGKDTADRSVLNLAVLDLLKDELDALDLAWAITPEKERLLIHFHHFSCREWSPTARTWTTVTSSNSTYQHGVANYFTGDRDANVQSEKR